MFIHTWFSLSIVAAPGNPIRAEGAKALASSLTVNRSMRSLYLSGLPRPQELFVRFCLTYIMTYV